MLKEVNVEGVGVSVWGTRQPEVTGCPRIPSALGHILSEGTIWRLKAWFLDLVCLNLSPDPTDCLSKLRQAAYLSSGFLICKALI